MPVSLTERSVASVPITLWEICVASITANKEGMVAVWFSLSKGGVVSLPVSHNK